MSTPLPETGASPERATQEASEILAIIDVALKGTTKVLFDVRSMEFLADTRSRFKKYGETTRITPKQLFYLRDLKDRLL